MDEAARQPFKDVETKETERFDAEMLAYNEPVRPHPFPSGPLEGVVEPSLGLACAQDAKAAREEAARTAVLAGEEKRAKLTAP